MNRPADPNEDLVQNATCRRAAVGGASGPRRISGRSAGPTHGSVQRLGGRDGSDMTGRIVATGGSWMRWVLQLVETGTAGHGVSRCWRSAGPTTLARSRIWG